MALRIRIPFLVDVLLVKDDAEMAWLNNEPALDRQLSGSADHAALSQVFEIRAHVGKKSRVSRLTTREFGCRGCADAWGRNEHGRRLRCLGRARPGLWDGRGRCRHLRRHQLDEACDKLKAVSGYRPRANDQDDGVFRRQNRWHRGG